MGELDLKHELGRKTIHLSSIIIVLAYHYLGKSTTLFFLTAVLILFLGAEYVRIELGRKIPFFWRFLRAREENAVGGEVFFIIGALIAISVFEKEIAIAVILMTTFGDMAAAIFGKAFGKTWIPGLKNRALEGCLAEFAVDMAIGLLFLPLPVALAMAVTATFTETVVTKMDDNLIIPIFAGSFGQLISIL